MSLTVIVLCGGQGSRIRSVLGRLPKILAPIGSDSFLDFLLGWIRLSMHSVSYQVILSTCIEHQQIQDYVNFHSLECSVSREHRPLGTLRAIIDVIERNSLKGDILILNGDTLFEVDFSEVYTSYIKDNSVPMLIVKPAVESSRYGGYSRSTNGSIRLTTEKPQYMSLGACFCKCSDIEPFKEKISSNPERQMMLDTDFLDFSHINVYELPSDVPFIDIGVPSDYDHAQQLIPAFFGL